MSDELKEMSVGRVQSIARRCIGGHDSTCKDKCDEALSELSRRASAYEALRRAVGFIGDNCYVQSFEGGKLNRVEAVGGVPFIDDDEECVELFRHEGEHPADFFVRAYRSSQELAGGGNT